jgi:CO/xanthine dehydrogenase FAD-binding subunit
MARRFAALQRHGTIDTLPPEEDYSRTNDLRPDSRRGAMYLRPRTLGEACKALAAGRARILSGGTDLFPAFVDKPLPVSVVDISRLSELDSVSFSPDCVRIGARTSWATIARTALPPSFDALKAAAREVGAIQVQNVATIGGNLCNASPAADGVPPLIALDAEVELCSIAGLRRLALCDFILGNRKTACRPDEILTAVIVPRTIDAGRSAFVKLGARKYMVISIVMVAAIVEADKVGRVAQARVAVGACSETAQRLPALEASLRGVPARPGLASRIKPAHVADLAPIDDGRASAAYRRDAAATLVARALELTVAGG